MHPMTWQPSRRFYHHRNISSLLLVLDCPRPPVRFIFPHTHAEMSAERFTIGIPTFRGSGGLWRKYDAMSLATYSAFRSNPSRVWQFYHYRREKSVTSPSPPSANPTHSTNLSVYFLFFFSPQEPSPPNLMLRTWLSPNSQ